MASFIALTIVISGACAMSARIFFFVPCTRIFAWLTVVILGSLVSSAGNFGYLGKFESWKLLYAVRMASHELLIRSNLV